MGGSIALRALELDRRPEPKLGAAARLESRGSATEQGTLVREVRAEREERRSLVDELRGWLAEKARRVAERAHAFKDALWELLQGLSGADLSRLREANLAVAVARADGGQEYLLSDRERSQVAEPGRPRRSASGKRSRSVRRRRSVSGRPTTKPRSEPWLGTIAARDLHCAAICGTCARLGCSRVLVQLFNPDPPGGFASE